MPSFGIHTLDICKQQRESRHLNKRRHMYYTFEKHFYYGKFLLRVLWNKER